MNEQLVPHQCRIEGYMEIEAGQPCNWCGVTEIRIDEERLQIHRQLALLYTRDEALAWLSAPQALLEHRIPARMMSTGEADKVLQALRRINDGTHV